MRATLAELAERHVPSTASTGLVPTLISGLFVQSITWWLENDRPSPPHEIADRSAKLASAILAEANTWPGAPPARHGRTTGG
jgi:hypothetical protein